MIEYATKDDISILLKEVKANRNLIKDISETIKNNGSKIEFSGHKDWGGFIEKLGNAKTDMEGAKKLIGVTSSNRINQLVMSGKLRKITNKGISPEFLIKDLVDYKYNFK